MGSFIEGVGKKISQTSQNALEKTKQLAEISKINMKLNKEEEQLEKLYANLGRLYYQLNKDQLEIIYQDIGGAIAGSIETIGYYQKMLHEVKGLKYCESCGKEATEGAVYCSHCGQGLDSQGRELVYRVCTSCGAVSTDEEAACSECQKSLE